MVLTDSRSGSYNVTVTSSRILIVATMGLNISETTPDSVMKNRNFPMGYRLRVLRMLSRDRMTS